MASGVSTLRVLERAGVVLLGAGACLYLLVYLVVALQRLTYPFELEWMEGGVVGHVQRILDGQAIYAQPSLSFVANLYAPLYFYVSALVALVLGNGFLPLRLVSFVASLGSFAFIFLIVRRRTSAQFPAFLAACLFAATFRIAGAWFDIARVDSLYLLFLLAGLYAFDSPAVLLRSLAAPLLLFLSAFTKQPALIVAIGLSVVALLTRKGFERLAFPLVFGVLFAGSFLVMNALTAGWYQYYVFEMPSQHSIESAYLLGFWTRDILQQVGIALGFCLVAAWSGRRQRIVADVCILGSLFLVSYLSRIHSGGYNNVLMAVYAAIAIYFGIGLNALLDAALKGDGRASAVTLTLLGAAMLQFLLLFYWPPLQVPSRADRAQGERILQRVARIQGEVYWSDHPWYLRMIGKPTQAQDMAIIDVLRAPGSGQWKQLLERDMARAIAEGRYEAFVVDFEEFSLRVPDFDARYELADANLSGSFFRMVTGYDRHPRYLYVRRP